MIHYRCPAPRRALLTDDGHYAVYVDETAVDVSSSDTQSDLKHAVKEAMQLDNDFFSLHYSGERLTEPEKSLADTGIGPEAALTVTIGLVVKCISDNSPTTTQLPERVITNTMSWTVFGLKENIKARDGGGCDDSVSYSQITVVSEGKELLDDDELVKEVGKGSVVEISIDINANQESDSDDEIWAHMAN